MSLTKKRLTLITLTVLLTAVLVLLYVVVSNIKPTEEEGIRPEIVLENIIPGKTTKQDLLKIKGSPSLTSELKGYEILHYSLPIEAENIFAIKEGVVSFYAEYQLPPLSFNEFSKIRGEGNIYYEDDDAFIWHVYPTKGIGAVVVGEELVRLLVFSPKEDDEFLVDEGFVLGLSQDEPEEEVLIVEPE